MAPATRTRKAELGKRLWWLILGRVATVICLLIAGLLWTHGAILRAASNSLNVTMILLAVAALTAIYTAARLLLKNLLLQARAIGPLLGLGGSVTVASAEIANKIQSVGLSDVSFLIVGLLAARLAERLSRSDVRLAAATQSLANLRALHERIVESIRSGVITTDLQRRIYTFNPAAEEITGYNFADVRGKDAAVFFGDMTERIADSMRAAAEGHA